MNGAVVLSDTTASLRDVWEETSFHLDQLQASPDCVRSERQSLQSRRCAPSYHVSFDSQTVMSRMVPAPSDKGYPLDVLSSSYHLLHC